MVVSLRSLVGPRAPLGGCHQSAVSSGGQEHPNFFRDTPPLAGLKSIVCLVLPLLLPEPVSDWNISEK